MKAYPIPLLPLERRPIPDRCRPWAVHRSRVNEPETLPDGILIGVTLRTGCCIAGGGPAGMTLGYLLARAGVEVMVLERHSDFLRDFRGDTLHPSTLEIMAELGLDTELLKLPHQPLPRMRGYIGDRQVTLADFSRLPVRYRFIATMPQWDFLNFLADKAQGYPSFTLQMATEAKGLIEKGRSCRRTQSVQLR